MQKGLLMVMLGGIFTLLGLFAMPMKRSNPRQNLIDNPFGWGLFGFGLSSLIIGISAMSKEKRQGERERMDVSEASLIEELEEISKPLEH